MIFLVDLKKRYNKWLINPRSIDIAGDIELDTELLKLDDLIKREKLKCIKNIPDDKYILFNEILFDTSEENWGHYYPRYECMVNFESKKIIELKKIDFENLIKAPFERREHINFEIEGGLKIQTELKGIRKFIEGFIKDNDLQDKEYAKKFLNNNIFIKKVIEKNKKQ